MKFAGLRSDTRTASRFRRVGYGLGLALALCMVFVIGKRMLEPNVIADWYAELAMQHLPNQFAPGTPVESSQDAYRFCIRRVVKETIESASVATFPSLTAENTIALGDGRWQVAAHVLEERENGERIRHDFRCTAQYERQNWVLQELTFGDLALTR